MGNDMYNEEQLADAAARSRDGALLIREAFLRQLHILADTKPSAEALAPQEWALACHDAALRLALETATRERDEARAERDAEREARLNGYGRPSAPPASRPMTRDEADAVEEIESAMFAPPPADAATEDNESGVEGICRACDPLVCEEQGRWQKRIEEVISMAGLEPCDASGNESGDPLDYSADQIESALSRALHPEEADAATEAVPYWTHQVEWGDGYRPLAMLIRDEALAGAMREEDIRVGLKCGPLVKVAVPFPNGMAFPGDGRDGYTGRVEE